MSRASSAFFGEDLRPKFGRKMFSIENDKLTRSDEFVSEDEFEEKEEFKDAESGDPQLLADKLSL